MAYVEVVDQEQFDKDVKGAEGLVLVDFWAPWCGPCKMLAPAYEALSEEYTDVLFTKVNVDEAGDIGAPYNIMSIPTILIFKDGELVDQKMGAMTKDQLRDLIKKNSEE